jgi:hypothetical protein
MDDFLKESSDNSVGVDSRICCNARPGAFASFARLPSSSAELISHRCQGHFAIDAQLHGSCYGADAAGRIKPALADSLGVHFDVHALACCEGAEGKVRVGFDKMAIGKAAAGVCHAVGD